MILLSKITVIENAIIQLGAGEFQKFCDTFLSKMDKYGAILGLGMKTGTLKTTTGNPDTYFTRANGKYVFVAYTTQQGSIYEKIKEDIEKCLDVNKTGVKLDDIEEIVCCHTSSNLSAGDDQKLHKMCEDKGISLTIFGVDEIAQQIYRNYPVIAKDFLNVPIDTNQILSMTDFISLYDASETAAPLRTTFQNRIEELATLKKSIRDNRVVIVHGAAGVGKTRLVLEAINSVAQEDAYNLLCVKNNNLQLYDDLIASTDKPGNYLFFIDDANELAGLNLILEHAIKRTPSYQFKIIMTVRDYAKESVVRESVKFVNPFLFELAAFSDEEIKDFLKVNMQIMNEQFVDPIIKIAEGNPRIAYMAGKLAKETQSLAAVHDATQVYEQYYATIVHSKLGDNRDLCLTAGILALVKAVMLEKLECLDELLKMGNISNEEFVNCIRQLSSMEVVEIHRDKVANISDQCLANYMLYYVFFSRKRIPFSKVLEVGFIHFKEGIIQSVNTLMNLFAKDELHSYIEEEVGKTWDKFKQEEVACFYNFARVFHVFRPEESFIIAAEEIEKIKQEIVSGRSIDFEKGTFKSGDEILDYLTGYKYSLHLETVIELLISYSQKSEEKAIIGFSWLKNHCGIDIDSHRFNYYTEKIILNKLGECTENNGIIQRFILAYIRYALAFEFRSTEMGRGNTFKMYTIQITNSTGVKEYRTKCWNVLKELANKKELTDEIVLLLKKYASSVRGVDDKSIAYDDMQQVIDIVSNLDCRSLDKAQVVRDFQYGWQKCEIEFNENNREYFQTREWKLFELLEDRWLYSGLEHDEYEEQRAKRLSDYADGLEAEEITEFIKDLASIVECLDRKSTSRYSFISGADLIIKQICNDEGMAWTVLNTVLSTGADIGINPVNIVSGLFTREKCCDIWNAITHYEYRSKNEWQMCFFQTLPEQMVDKYTYDLLIGFLQSDSDKDIQSSTYRNLHFLDKFMVIDPEIYVTASKLILEKRSYNGFIVQMYFAGLFNEHLYSPEQVISLYNSDMTLLREIFFFTLKTNCLVDYKSKFLIVFLSIDDSWINEYAEMIYEKVQNGRDHDYDQYIALWMSDDYMRYFNCIFDKVSENYDDLSSWRLANVFKEIFVHPEGDRVVEERQKQWILHNIEKYSKDRRIICLFSALAETEYSLRNSAFQMFFKCNDEYEMFEKLQLDPNHWGGSMDELIPDLHRKIQFLESLLPYVKGVKYLKHAKRIRDRIDFWKAMIEKEELDSICRKLYT